MDSILQSTPRLIRALFLIAGLGLGIFLITIGIFKRISNTSDISLEANEKGGFIFKIARKTGEDNRDQYAQILLPSNSCWHNTGLDIREDEECEIKVTGNVHLAFNRLYRDVEGDAIPAIKWTGPEGNEWAKIGDNLACEEAKAKLLIKPGRRIGNVVGFLYTQNIADKDFVGFFMNNRKQITDEIKIINNQNTICNDKKATATLYLCVNDILLDTTDTERKKLSLIAFEGRYNNTQKWESLKKEKEYYRLWFDDNVGGFLVSVIIRKRK